MGEYYLVKKDLFYLATVGDEESLRTSIEEG
jgi:hypothetical protein